MRPLSVLLGASAALCAVMLAGCTGVPMAAYGLAGYGGVKLATADKSKQGDTATDELPRCSDPWGTVAFQEIDPAAGASYGVMPAAVKKILEQELASTGCADIKTYVHEAPYTIRIATEYRRSQLASSAKNAASLILTGGLAADTQYQGFDDMTLTITLAQDGGNAIARGEGTAERKKHEASVDAVRRAARLAIAELAGGMQEGRGE